MAGAQIAVRLYQTTQTVTRVVVFFVLKNNNFLITVHIAYAITNKTKIVSSETEFIFLFYPWQTRFLFTCASLSLSLNIYKLVFTPSFDLCVLFIYTY